MEQGRRLDAEIARGAAIRHGLVTRPDAHEDGVTDGQIRGRTRSGRWDRLARGTYAIAGTPPTWARSLAALSRATGGPASHLAAARLRGFRPLPARIGPEVSVEYGRSARSPLGKVHRSRDLHLSTVDTIDGIAVTGAARTLLDIARQVHPDRFSRIVDDALDRKLVTLAELDASLTRHRRRGRPGVTRLAAVLAERGDGLWVTESVFERRFLTFCDTYRIPRPRTQVLLDFRGRVFARCDCVWDDARLIVELDGRKGHLQLVNSSDDAERDQLSAGLGWRTIRVRWLQFARRPEPLAERLLAALSATHPEP